MATAKEILLSEALRFADEVIRRTADDDPVSPGLLHRKGLVETAIREVEARVGYRSGFRPIVWGDLQCPHCWVLRDVHTALTPVGTDDPAGRYRCKICNYEVSTGNA